MFWLCLLYMTVCMYIHGIMGWTGSMLWCVQCSWGLVVRWVLAGRELIHSSPSPPPPPPSLSSNSTLTTLLASECPLDHRFHMVAVGQRRGVIGKGTVKLRQERKRCSEIEYVLFHTPTLVKAFRIFSLSLLKLKCLQKMQNRWHPHLGGQQNLGKIGKGAVR